MILFSSFSFPIPIPTSPCLRTNSPSLYPLHFRAPLKPSTSRPTQQQRLSCSSSPLLLLQHCNDDGGGNNNNSNNGNNGWWDPFGFGGNSNSDSQFNPLIFFCLRNRGGDSTCSTTPGDLSLFVLSLLGFFWPSQSSIALENGKAEVWEVRSSKRTRLVPDPSKDAFVVVAGESGFTFDSLKEGDTVWSLGLKLVSRFNDLILQLMLPEGYPDSVTSDYLEYSLWRSVQGVASQVSGVLATQALLYAVGLGKGAIPTAAAINWVLKDGIGYLSKIVLSNYGRHFDVNPKGWRLFADLLENAAFGMEILTPAFPHLFVVIGAAAGAGRSAAALIQAATRSCFYAGFAAQRNFAEVIAKGEAQGMVSKSIGIMLGIALANGVGSSTPLSLASFAVVTWVHMYCNLKSYQSVLLRTLNPYRASLVFNEYLLSGQIPHVREVNDEEPLFPSLPLINANLMRKVESQLLSAEAKVAAREIEKRLQIGSKLSEVVNSKEDAIALFDLYGSEGYILAEHSGQFCIILKEGSSPKDMLKSLFHVNYLYWLEKNVGIESGSISNDCKSGGKLQISLDYVQREFNHVRNDGELAGWSVDGLIVRPLPNRICVENVSSVPIIQ
ncbi:hypothetical protein Scep_007286 [Stephania cephalantha]|uniref:Protein root UVB sensitive 1, chloroplastic n=1 Tax=Stephania cephalantha TaxID=152367 RepID=A0AAP0KBA1_9MAGN